MKKGRKTRDRAMTLKEQMMPETRDVAPLLMFSAVRASAAVAGMPPNMPDIMLAIEIANTSCRWLNLVLVIRSAILHCHHFVRGEHEH